MSPFTQVQTAAPVAPAPPGRPVDDPAVVRSAIFDRALGAVRALPPVTSATHTLRIANPAYDGPDNVGTADYKRALLTGDTLARRLRGDVELVDNASGNVIQSKRLTLAAVPYYTDAGVFVNRGTKYAMANQQRLRSGAYTRIRDNGEVETHINVAPGQGVPFRVFLEPSTGIFKAKIDQAQIPLVPLLQSLGVDDAKLRTAWGNQLAAANVAKTRGGDLQKLYTRLVRRGTATTPAQQQAEIRQLLENTRLDPDVMTHTLKAPYDRVNADLLLATTRKLLAVHNRKNPEMLQRLGLEPDDQDDRDHLAFMRLLGPEDIIAERLGTAQRVLRPLLWRAGRTRTLDHVAPGLFSRIVQDAIVGSGLGQATEDINPLQVFEQQLRTTRMGIGGIPSDDSVPESSRSVQPSHAGYIDPIVTPECFDDQTEVMTRRGWVPWPEITDLDEFAVQLDGRLDWRRATALHAGHYAGQMVVADTDILNFCVTPNHRLWTRPDQAGDSRYRFEEARYSYHRSRKFACAGHKPSAGQSRTSYHVPGVPRGANNQVALPPIAIDDWAEFLGWFLSEGSVNICLKPGKQNYFVNLSQSRVAHPQLHADLRALCARLPFRLSCGPRAVVVGGKQITLYLRQFGRSHEKFIPEEAFDWPESARRRLLVGLLKGDGRKGKFDVERLAGLQFCTTSARLADGVARLAFSLGFSSRTVIEPENRAERYHDIHVVHIHSRWERSLQQRHLWRLEPYVGTVYCATVPGGLLYVRRNGKVGHWSGNSGRAGVDVRLSRLVRKGSDGELYSKFIDMRTGQAAWRQPKELFDSVIAFSQARAATPERPHTAASYARFRNALDRGEIVQSRSGQYFVQGLKRGQLDYYPLKDVDYAIPHMEDTFSPTANLVPGKSGMKGQRVAMGARMLTQALPLVDAEAPLVQSGVPDSDQSFEELYSPRLGAIRAKSGGRVLAHTDAGLLVQYDDGTRDTIELAQYVPGSRKTFMHQEPTVSPGARFEAGQLVARSNFTDGAGVTALGRNLRTAWLPLKGLNYEDAVVVSESGAKKLTSQHMYKTSVDIDKKSDQVGLAAYRGIFPKRFTQPQLDKVDDDGVVKVGTRVESGDPLVLVANERQGRVGELSRAGAARWRDAAEVWEHDHPGIVTDVAKTKSGVVVAVKSIAPMQVGDKLCYDELTEVLTRRGWVRVADLLLTDKICTLQDGDAVVYCEPTALHRYQTGGRMYRIETQQVDLFVTAEHRMYVRPRSRTEFGLYSADQIAGKRVEYLKSGRWLGVEPPTVTLPGVTVRHGGRGDAARRLPDLVLPTETYLLLLGAFLSEGNLVDNPRSGSYGIDIAQSKEPNRSQLYAALDAAGIRYSRHGGGEKIRIYSKVLLQHFRTCGNGAGGKRIPDVVFDFSARLCGVLFKWLMWGDGHATQAGRPVDYTTTSPGLADDVQRLCLHAGWAANVKQTQPAGVRILGGQPYQCAATYRVRIVTKKLTPTVNHSHVHRQGGQVEYFVDNYAGPVFCVTVPNHVLYVRRNGKPCWSGNSNRFGSKGVVAAIIPDDQMPRDESGQPIELALNDLGITTRTNPVQVIEAVLGKIAAKRGQPYKLHDFDSISDLRAFAKREADKYGVKGAEDLEDPETGRKIPRVMTGQHFVMKLHHTSESKVSGRAFGSYTADAIPAKGGSEGAKTWGMLHLNAILSHGAVSVAKDGHMVRGQRNPQYWAAVMSGKAPPDPPVPPVYHKFIAQLQASGIHPVRQGTRTHLMAMTDKTINEMAEDRELSSPDTVDWTDDGLKPIPGGLFDERLFGGVSGCFHPSVTVWTERGPLPIGQIVQQRLAVRVQTYNFQTQRFELKPITNWFQNCSREGIGRAVFADGVAGRLAGRHARYNPTTLWGTRGHQVYDGGGQKHDLAAATQLTFAVESLSYTQEQLIYGTLLGDGHVRPDGLYDASHSMRQAGYLRLKHAILRPLCDNPPVEFLDTSGGLSRRKIRFLTKAHDALRQARNLCYVGQRKTLSAEWLAKVDEMGLAFWFFDDGSVHRNRGKNTVYVKFCTECFSSVEVQLLQRWLAARWGLSDSYLARDAVRYEDRDCGWQICLAGDNAWQLLTLVAPYAEQSVRYKFPVRPRMASCACGSEIAPAVAYCNRCLLTAAAACGPGKLPRTVRDRFGGSAATRTLLNTGTVPPTTLPLAAWQAVRDVLGCAVAKMQTDTELRLSLREEPVQFLWQTGARWERTRTVYDIEVADNHNYFANGVLVSNSRWAKITLPEPLPNPVMEEPIRRVLGLTGPQFERIIAGREQFAGGTGPAAIASALDKIDIDRELERAGREIEGTRKTARDAAIRRVGFLLGARKTGVHPRDWMWHSVPVLPPRWRPVSRMQGTDAPMVADANYLYRDLFENKRNLEQLRGQLADVGDERLALYQSVRAVTGLGDPAPEHLREQQIKGSLRHIIGCYDDKTEILTQAGWVRFSDLPEDVPVATLNPSTAAFEWQLPTAYQRYRYCGELVRIQVGSRPRPKQQDVRVGTRIDLLLTPNHRNWVRRRLREYPDSELSRGWGFEEAWQTAAFTGRSWWRTAAASWQGVDVLPDFLNCRFEAFAELVGWWIAEGWIHSDRKIVNLSQETARNRAKCERIAALLKEVGLRHTRHDYVRQPDAYHTKSTAFAVWSIMSEDLVAWLVEHGGELAGNKRLSPAIKNWSTAGLEALLRGYLGGDGCARTIAAVTGIQRRTHKNRSRLTDVYHRVGTTSPQLFDDLQEVACKLGLTLRYSRDGNGVGNQAILTVGSLGGQQLTQTEGTAGKSFEHYDGFVYCCTVPNGIVLVRRNGIPVFSGNSSPKFGVVQRRLLGSQTDLVGRGTIVPNPDLDMDQVGIPEDQAWQVYRPFIVRHLAKRGVAPGRAAEMVLARNDVAKQALSTVMAERPVLLDRAPVLHRFGVMAFWPRIAKGNQIELTPIVTKGFGADFDGDAMQFHVPGSDDAVEDAVTKMLPSANLRAPANFKVHQLPQQEYLAGLYRATRDRKNETPQRFAKLRDMLAALSRGDISHDQPVVIDE